MKRQQILGLLALLLVSAAVIGTDALGTKRQQTAEDAAYAELMANTPVAELEGETVSPDGRFEVRTAGKSGHYVSGVVTPEKLKIVDRETGEVKWEDQGWVTQSALWSPESRHLALAYGARTWQAVKIFETDTWTSWDFILPDGTPIPEYTFLPEDWGTWVRKAVPEESYDLLLTVGWGGDAGEQHTYRCSVLMEKGQLVGNTLEQTIEVLPGSYDFDHDGKSEVTELVTVWEPETEGRAAWYELRIGDWTQEAALAHVGWTSIFALELDGQDYLLRYNPWVGQGYATYDYQIFSLDEAGREVLLKENGVEFDISFGSPHHESFDPSAIASFLEEIHGYLDGSTLLLTTEGGEFTTGGSGADSKENMDFWDEYCPYDESKSLEENLRNYESFSRNS